MKLKATCLLLKSNFSLDDEEEDDKKDIELIHEEKSTVDELFDNMEEVGQKRKKLKPEEKTLESKAKKSKKNRSAKKSQ